MTRAKDISKIVTDANLSGTLDVTGTITVGDGHTIGDDGSDNLVITSSSGEAVILSSGASAYIRTLGGTNRFLVDGATGDISFYEDTGTTPKLFWDASEERLGIGHSSPNVTLHIQGANASSGDSNHNVVIDDTTSMAQGVGGGIVFRGNYGSGLTNGGFIQTEKSNATSGNYAFDLVLGSRANGSSPAERMRITSDGNVGIGTSSPDSKLDVATGANGAIFRYDIASTFLQILPEDANGDISLRYRANSGSAPDLLFKNDGGTEAMRITSAGNVGIGTSSGNGNLTVASTGDAELDILADSDNNGSNQWPILNFRINSPTGTPSARIYKKEGDGALIFDNAGTERMRIGSNGHLYATCNDGSLANLTLRNGASGDTPDFLQCRDSANNLEMKIEADGDVYNANGTYGSISDQKLKENIIDASSQWDDIKALQIRKYNLIGNEQVHIGVVAQELEAAGMSGLVSESIDLDEDGNDLGTTTKSVKYSILHTKALKALQEAMTRIEALETANTALEARITALENGE